MDGVRGSQRNPCFEQTWMMNNIFLSLSFYIYIYIYKCVCVCVCAVLFIYSYTPMHPFLNKIFKNFNCSPQLCCASAYWFEWPHVVFIAQSLCWCNKSPPPPKVKSNSKLERLNLFTDEGVCVTPGFLLTQYPIPCVLHKLCFARS